MSDEITVILTQTMACSPPWLNLVMTAPFKSWPDPYQNQAWLPISRTLRSVQLQKEQRQSMGGVVWHGVGGCSDSPVLWRFGPDRTVSARGPGLLKDKMYFSLPLFMRWGGGEGAGSQRLSTAVDPFSASSGPRPPLHPLHPHPDAREGDWGGGVRATAVKLERVIER